MRNTACLIDCNLAETQCLGGVIHFSVVKMKRYRFHYNNDLADVHEEVYDGELTYHEHLVEQDGNICSASVEDAYRDGGGKLMTEAFFDDGNELTVYVDELEEIAE